MQMAGLILQGWCMSLATVLGECILEVIHWHGFEGLVQDMSISVWKSPTFRKKGNHGWHKKLLILEVVVEKRVQ